MTVNELIQELVNIRAGGGGSLPVIAKIEVVQRRTCDCVCEEGCHEEKTEVSGEAEIWSARSEMVPPSRGDAKRKVVLR
jgi:hypothetical protein